MDLGLWGLIAGSGWGSGVNLYLVTLLLGGAGRVGLMDVPPVLERTDVLIAAGVMFVLEFVADKVPLLDSLWDVVHTAIRPVGAALIGYTLGGDTPEVTQLTGAAVSGGLAVASHLAKATIRAAINVSPEPLSNVVASLVEDGLVIGVVFLVVVAPLLGMAIIGVLLLAGAALAVALHQVARRGRQRLRDRREARRTRGQVPVHLDDPTDRW